MASLLHPLLAMLASLTQQDVARQVVFLREENRILRSRLSNRIGVTPSERSLLLTLGRDLGTQLQGIISIVSYDTFRRWVREAETKHITHDQPPQRTGRPRTASDIRELVLRLARENSWGYTRILGELRKLGITRISRQTVKAILKEQGIPPAPDRSGGTWTEFIRIHADTLWQCDFLTKPIWTPKGLVNLYVLVFLHIGTRRLWLSPATRRPDAAWVSEQAESFLAHAHSTNLPTTIMLRDNDVKYPPGFDTVLKAAGLDVPKMPVRAPNLRAHVERVIQTLQHEALDRLVIVSERHLNFINRHLQDWYNNQRPHSARDHLPPGWDDPPTPNNTAPPCEIVCTTRLGGLLKFYARRAA